MPMTGGGGAMMFKGKLVFFFFAFLVLTALASVSEAKTIYVPDDYEKIQWAVYNASAGDNIIVRDGKYYENLKVDKKLTIKSENGSANCIVDGGGNGDVITLIADGIAIEGFTVRNSGDWPNAGIKVFSNTNKIAYNCITNNEHGIYLRSSCNNTIANNTASSNNWDGIFLYYSSSNTIDNNTVSNNLYGIYLRYSSNNIIANNTASNNYDGIDLLDSSSNIIANNTVSNNRNGIYLLYSSNNTLANNNMFNNAYNFYLWSWQDSHFDNNIDTTNTVDGKPIYYIKNASNNVYDSSTNAGTFYCIWCDNVTVKDLNLTKNGYGVFFRKTNNSRIENVIASNNYHGIDLWYSSNNILANNIASSNYDYGIYLRYSSNNIIANNTASNNYDGIHIRDCSNNTLANNIASSNNDDGIYIGLSSNNIIANNTASNNYDGIHIRDCSNNFIYLNNFINNTYQVESYHSTNIWNSTEKIKYTYKGKQHTNYLGNYWSDYTGSDADEDGIGDTPYIIDDDKDEYPLIEHFEHYFAPDEPKVSISTDKYEYRAGDLMLINITFENPTDEGKSVKFLWILDIPDYNLSFTVINNKSLSLPSGFKKTFVISWTLPNLRASFNASWYVALYSDGVISEDTADWRYVCATKRKEREIAFERNREKCLACE